MSSGYSRTTGTCAWRPVGQSPWTPGPPVITSLSPAAAPVGGAAFTLTVDGSAFTSESIVRWNGANRVTTFVSPTRLLASIPATDLATVGTAQVTAFDPPSGRTSPASPFSVQAAPVLSVSSTTATTGTAVTVSDRRLWRRGRLAGVRGHRRASQQLRAVHLRRRSRDAHVDGHRERSGTYEFRLFLNNSYTLAATSPTITATVGTPPVLTVSTITAAPGAPVTMTLTNGYGGGTDWLALAQTGSPHNSYLQLTYVGGSVTTRTWTVTMPNTPGTYEFRLFLNNGSHLPRRVRRSP